MVHINNSGAVADAHPNAQLVRDFFDSVAVGDMDTFRSTLTSDIVWHMVGKSPLAGDWKGPDGILNGISALVFRLGGGKYSSDLLQVFANDTHAISISRDYYRGEENPFDLKMMLYFKIEDSRITEVWEVPFDLYEFDRFFSTQQERLTAS